MIIKTDETTDRFSFKDFPKPKPSEFKEFEINSIDAFINNKSKQFITSNGLMLARIDVEIDNPISLNYHYKNTGSFDEFIESINRFMTPSNSKLSQSDINKLQKMYENHVRIILGNKPHSQEIIDILINSN